MALGSLVIDGGTVITPRQIIPNGRVVVAEGSITAVGPAGDIALPRESNLLSAVGKFVAPGFIDIHVNGGGGGDTLDASLESLQKMVKTHARGGTTSMVPTIVTASIDDMCGAVNTVRQAKADDIMDGSEILGAFLEGPYITKEQKGAHNPRYIILPDPKEYRRFLEMAEDVIMVGLAPELPGAFELIRELHKENIRSAIAHTNATYREVITAIEAGCTHIVHLFSSMSSMFRKPGRSEKYAGVTEAALLCDELTVEIIGDGKHVPESLMRLTLKAKSLETICSVTDAMRAAGLKPGRYTLGDLDIIVEDNVAVLPDRSCYAGSVATMDLCVRNMVTLGGLTVAEAVKTATINPARVIGAEDRKGSLVPGKDADIVIFDENIDIYSTIVAGKVQYSR